MENRAARRALLRVCEREQEVVTLPFRPYPQLCKYEFFKRDGDPDGLFRVRL